MSATSQPEQGEHEGQWFETRGAGEWIILLHGFPSSSDDWEVAAAALSSVARVLRLDLLGYGRSRKPPRADYSVAAHVDRLLRLCTHLGIRRATLVGHDLGGILVQEMVHRAETGACDLKITAVAFLNISLYHRLYRPTLLQHLLSIRPLGRLLARLVDRRGFERSLVRVWGHTKPSLALLDRMWQRFTADNGHRLAPDHLQYIRERRAHGDTWMHSVERFAGPMLLLWGIEDPVSGPPVLAHAQTRLPLARIVRLAAGHFPQIEQPERAAHALHDWYRAVVKAPGMG